MARRTDYPIYSVCALKEGIFCVTGGGGPAKTGVPNVLEIYQLSHDGAQFQSELKHRHTFEKQLIMNIAPCPQRFWNTIAASIDTSCHIFSLQKADVEQKTEEQERGKHTESTDSSQGGRVREIEEKYEVKEVASKTTVFSDARDAQQKVVKFSPAGYHVITGGTDGVVRMFKYPSLVLEQEFKAGEGGSLDEVTDLDYHPTEPTLVAVHRNGAAVVWSMETGKQSFKWTWSPNSSAYRFRACSFLPSNKEKELLLYSINIPCVWRGRESSYLVKWNVGSSDPVSKTKTGKQLLTALAVGPAGDYLGVGFSDGSVAIYSTNLQLLTRADGIHSTFVTAVSFISLSGAKSGQQSHKLALVSASADRSYHVMLPQKTRTGLERFVLLPILVAFIAVVVYLFTKYFGLD